MSVPIRGGQKHKPGLAVKRFDITYFRQDLRPNYRNENCRHRRDGHPCPYGVPATYDPRALSQGSCNHRAQHRRNNQSEKNLIKSGCRDNDFGTLIEWFVTDMNYLQKSRVVVLLGDL